LGSTPTSVATIVTTIMVAERIAEKLTACESAPPPRYALSDGASEIITLI